MNKKTLLALTTMIFASSVFAGGDNTVTMTDIKEATYKLVMDSKKTNEQVLNIDERLKNVEPKIPFVQQNTQNINGIIRRLNELGIADSVSKNKEVTSVIENYVTANKYLLPTGEKK